VANQSALEATRERSFVALSVAGSESVARAPREAAAALDVGLHGRIRVSLCCLQLGLAHRFAKLLVADVSRHAVVCVADVLRDGFPMS
jgi:hypothetical protein